MSNAITGIEPDAKDTGWNHTALEGWEKLHLISCLPGQCRKAFQGRDESGRHHAQLCMCLCMDLLDSLGLCDTGHKLVMLVQEPKAVASNPVGDASPRNERCQSNEQRAYTPTDSHPMHLNHIAQ